MCMYTYIVIARELSRDRDNGGGLEVKGLFNSHLLFFLSIQKEVKAELKYSYF